MNIEQLRSYCINKKGVEECLPFGPDTLVFKVMGKVFLLCGLENNPIAFNAKCDPERAIALREKYASVQPGYHMNKTHWNTISADGELSLKQLQELIDHSYDLVAASLSKAQKAELSNL